MTTQRKFIQSNPYNTKYHNLANLNWYHPFSPHTHTHMHIYIYIYFIVLVYSHIVSEYPLVTWCFYIGFDTICHDPRKVLTTSTLYPKRISWVSIWALHNHLYSLVWPSKHLIWDSNFHTIHTYLIQST